MLGAVIGDIVGSAYEFDNTRDYNFVPFGPKSNFTDDSIISFAVAKWLLDDPGHSYQGLEDAMVSLARDYPHPTGGYGGGFQTWLFAPKLLRNYDSRYGELPYRSKTGRHPYGSWGNGAAMRVSAVGWCFDSLEETERVAAISAAITHNHPEGIKGAQATAAAIWMARNGKEKEDIRRYIESAYGYDLHQTWEQWRKKYHWEDSCQGTVPQAIICFLDSSGFEDAIRKAVSLGGDSDTLACITGGIAEAWYGGVPAAWAGQAVKLLPERFASILEALRKNTAYGQLGETDKTEAKEALLMWQMGLGDSNKRLEGKDFNPEKKKKATAKSWKTEPMQDRPLELPMDFALSDAQMAIISLGHIPEVMEDHWFMYCDEAWIRYHRSWSGLCAFEAGYEQSADGYRIVTLRMHAEDDRSEQYAAKQKALFLALLLDECGGDSERFWDEYLGRSV